MYLLRLRKICKCFHSKRILSILVRMLKDDKLKKKKKPNGRYLPTYISHTIHKKLHLTNNHTNSHLH